MYAYPASLVWLRIVCVIFFFSVLVLKTLREEHLDETNITLKLSVIQLWRACFLRSNITAAISVGLENVKWLPGDFARLSRILWERAELSRS